MLKGKDIRYAIYHTEFKGYSTGGYMPNWVPFERAKLWRLGPLKNHLNQFATRIPDTWHICSVRIKHEIEETMSAKLEFEEYYLYKEHKEREAAKKSHKEYLLREKQRIDRELEKL